MEGNADLAKVALVGIHTRGVPLAQRLRRRIEELSGTALAFGQLDITFHRDDVHVRGGEAPRHPQPLVRSTTVDFPLEGMTWISPMVILQVTSVDAWVASTKPGKDAGSARAEKPGRD